MIVAAALIVVLVDGMTTTVPKLLFAEWQRQSTADDHSAILLGLGSDEIQPIGTVADIVPRRFSSADKIVTIQSVPRFPNKLNLAITIVNPVSNRWWYGQSLQFVPYDPIVLSNCILARMIETVHLAIHGLADRAVGCAVGRAAIITKRRPGQILWIRWWWWPFYLLERVSALATFEPSAG